MDNQFVFSSISKLLAGQSGETLALIILLMEPKDAARFFITQTRKQKIDIVTSLLKYHEKFAEAETLSSIYQLLENILKKLKALIADQKEQYPVQTDGYAALLNMYELSSRGIQKNIADVLKEVSPAAHDSLIKDSITFHDILKLDNRFIQQLLRKCDAEVLAKALKNEKKMQKIVFANMDKRSENYLKEEIDYLGPITALEKDNAQKEIITLMRRLKKENIIKFPGKGDDELV